MATAQQTQPQEKTVYDRLVELVFSGTYEPGSKLPERDLAEQLKVSRIPVREALGKMVAQGLLLGGGRREGVRLRRYMPDEIRQLYEFRQYLEVGIVGSATKYAKEEDLARLESIWQEMDKHVGEYGSPIWAKCDHAFHETLAQASHNKRAIQMIGLLLTECHFVFYLRPSRQRRQPTPEEATKWMTIVHEEHRALINHILAGEAEQAVKIVQRHLVPDRF